MDDIRNSFECKNTILTFYTTKTKLQFGLCINFPINDDDSKLSKKKHTQKNIPKFLLLTTTRNNGVRLEQSTS